ncbi:hypothetical protein R5R35_004578 [Gryllus longicercus]|uniref:Prefoldin subunit n=1 Tax=Gryllus longicercus TaxID=2509291 RepID=A0AAN9W0C3_9ORTH
MESSGKQQSSSVKTPEQVTTEFKLLKAEYQRLAKKLTEVEMELNEHKVVIEHLKQIENDRKCFRMIDGYLCEMTVKDVLPALEDEKRQKENFIVTVTRHLTEKEREIHEFREKYKNVRERDIQISASALNKEPIRKIIVT